MNYRERIRKAIECPQFGDETYGEWGALNLEQRKFIKRLLDELDRADNYIKKVYLENQELKEQLLVAQTNEETFRLEMKDITQTLGLDEDTLFDDVKAYARSLKENKILRENAEHNDKVVDKVNWENMLLKKENQDLKKQLEEYKREIVNETINKIKREVSNDTIDWDIKDKITVERILYIIERVRWKM